MADGYISQIKTPDNKTYLLRDSEKTDEKVKQTSNAENKEFPIILKNTNNTTDETAGVKYTGGVTVNPSEKTVTADEFIGNLNMGRLVPISTKTYNAPLYQSSGANFYQNFATVTPTDYNAIWIAHYRITVTAAGHSDYTEICDVSISGRANTYYSYKIYNSIVTYSIYQHMLLNSNSASVPHELGYRMQGSYGADNVAKVIKVELLEQLNCTVTLLDNLKLYTSATPSGYTWRGFTATSNGLQEAGDNDAYGYYILSNGFKGKAGSNKVYRYCLFARTGDGTYESFVMESNTRATTKTANPHGFVPDGKIYWNSSGSDYSEGTLNISPYEQYHTLDYLYSFNFDNQFLPDYCETYVVYTYNENDGLLYLDTTQWLAAALPTTEDGKIYQRIGSKYYTGTSNYYQGSLLLDNPYYEYRDGEIRSWSATHLSSITGADDLKAIEAISGTIGLLKKTAANTWTLDTNSYVTSSGITSVTIGATSPVQSSTSTAQNGSSASTTISLKDAYGDTKNPYGAKAKNLILAGPSSGNNAVPSFRALVAADIPNSILKWQTTTAESTALYDFGVYVNMNNANGSGMKGSNFFSILNVPYRKASGNTIADWGWQLGNITSNDGRLWYRTAGNNVWGEWQTIAHATQSTSDIGSATQPVYMTSNGVITAGTALGTASQKAESYFVKAITSTDNAIVRFDGTSGQIQKSGITIDDSDNMTIGSNRILNQTAVPGQGEILLSVFGFKTGYPLYTDPTFLSGMNSIGVYNNSGGGTVTHTRGSYASFEVPSPGTDSSSIIKIETTGTASPGCGGFVQSIPARANAQFVQIFRALVPADRKLYIASNGMGTGYRDEWLTSNNGTGKWEWYARRVICGQEGTISVGGHVYIDGNVPVTWYLASCNVYDITKTEYDGLKTRYADQANAANLTSTANAVAYYTDAAGKFGSKASANGALYATSANGALQWGTLPIAQGGTGKTTANDAANALISGLPTWTASPTADTYFIRRDTGGTATFGQVKFSSIANITNGKITLGPYSITPVTSVNGHTGNEVTVTASDLGLSTAMHFLGVSTTAITDGGTENPTIGGTAITTKTAGDVVIDNNSRREYVWSTTNKWEMLGFDASTAYSQTTSGNTFISSVSQATDGTVTAGTRALDTSGTWSGNAATATKLKDNATNTTRVFYRGDNTWSNILKQTSAAVLGIDTNSKIGTAVKDLHFTVGSGSGTGINDGNAGGITIGTDTASYGGIYWQSSGSYGLRLHFATTGSFANGAYTRMLITHDGKVGIGTLTPDTLLTVNGNAKADKFIGALQGNADTATNATNHIARTDNPHNVTAAQLGLGSVENTKLSTWAGSTNITTLGTIITGTWNGTAIANNKLANSSLTVGNKSINLGASGTVDEIITYSTTIGQNTSWDVTDSGTYRAYNSGGFSGDQNPGTNQNAPYPYGTLYVMRATTGGAAQFYISHHASAAKNAENGIRYRSGWDVTNTEKTAAQRWEAWATILDDKNYNLYSPKLDGTGATGSWGITITGNAANVTGTVAIDHGGTGATTAANARTNLGLGTIATKADTAYIKFGGDDTGLGGSSPAATAKTYWADATKVSDNMITGYYNHSGTEYSLLFSKRSTYGSILKWGYGDRYLRILRVQSGTWKSTDWEKIDAGYADSAGTATSAGKWTTARTLTIGSTGKSVDGSGNVSWSLTEIGAAASGHEHDYIGNSRYIAYTTDGHYEGSGTVTGYIKIKIPKTKSATMLSFDVDIYNYSGDTSTRYHIAGYNYTDASWNNTTAYCIAPLSNAKANLTVRFLSNGDDEMYVTIGETDTSWSYPKVNVHNIVMGHSGNSLANWASGWTITITNTAFTSGQIKVTKTNTNIAYTAITAGTSTLAWNEEKTLYTIGDAVIKAKLPAMPTYSDVGAAPASTVSCTTANVQSILGINTSSGSTSKALTEKGTWVTFGTSNLTIGTTSTTAMAGNTTVTNVAISADTTTNKNYALVFGTTPSDGATPTGAKTEGLQKNIAKLYVNPNTGNIQATTFNGYTLAAASAKSVVTSIDASASLPTSNAVKTFVEGKGYVTSSDITTAINDLDGTIAGTPSNTNTITAFSQTNGKVSATFAAIDFPVTSVAGLTNAISASALTEALGLSKALRFVGVTTTDMTGGTATNHTYTGKPAGISDYTPAVGDVVINSTKQDEWVCIAVSGTTYTWERLGSDTSYKIVQSAVSDPAAASTTSTTFIDTISQNANGVISATKKTLPTASTEVAGIIKIGTGSTNAMAGDTTITNVSYTATTDNYEYPILMKNSTGSDTTAAGVRFASGANQQVTINPSTGTVSTRRLVINNSSSNGTVPDLVFSRTSWSYINIPDNDAAVLAIGRGTGDNASQKLIIQGDGVVRPGSDNTQVLGKSTRRWKEVHGVNFYGTFNGTATYSQGLAKWAISNSDLNNFVSNGALRYSWEGGNNNFNSKPTDVNAFGIIAMKTATNWTGQLLMSTDSEPGLYWRTNLTTETPSYGSWTPLASGNGGVYYGTCETASNVAEKAVSCKHYHTLKAGDIIVVTFTNSNSEASPKLNVNNTGAVAVKMAYSGGIVDLGSTSQLRFTCTFIYDGTYWLIINQQNAIQLATSDGNLNWRSVLLSDSNSINENFTPTANTLGRTYAAHNVKYQPSTGTLRAPIMKTPKVQIEYDHVNKAHIQWNDTDSSIDFIFD